jgi:hypothetical protein
MSRTLIFLAIPTLVVLACAGVTEEADPDAAEDGVLLEAASRCLKQEAAPALPVPGTVKFLLTVAESGAITDVVVVGSEPRPKLTQCMKHALLKHNTSASPWLKGPGTVPFEIFIPK